MFHFVIATGGTFPLYAERCGNFLKPFFSASSIVNTYYRVALDLIYTDSVVVVLYNCTTMKQTRRL